MFIPIFKKKISYKFTVTYRFLILIKKETKNH